MHKGKIVLLALILQLALASCLPKAKLATPSPSTRIPVSTPSSAMPTPQSALATPIPHPTPVVTITFACPGLGFSEYQKLAEKFHQANPDIIIHVVSIDDILGTGSRPKDATYQVMSRVDTALMYISWADSRQRLLRNLQPFIEADPSFRPEDFYPATLEVFRWDGGTWALPRVIDPMLIFYDKDAFDEARIPYPQPGWSWEEFVEVAKALTVRREEEVARYGFADQWATSALGMVPGMAGRALVDEIAQPPVPVLDHPEVAAAANRYLKLALDEKAMFTGYETGNPRQVFELIAGKQAAMWTEEARRWRQRAEGFRLGALPLPKGKVSNNLVWVQGLVISAGTAHPEESWRWLEFLSWQQPVEGEMVPARLSVIEDMSYWEGLDDELSMACRYALEHAITWWTYRKVTSSFYQAIRTVLAGEGEIKETLTKAQQQIYEETATLLKSPPASISVPTVVPPEAERPAGAVTITFASFLSRRRKSYLYRTLVEDFIEDHPDITVKLIFPQGTFSFEDRAASVDCFQWFGPLSRSPSAVLDLEPFIEADPEFDLKDFYPQALEAFRWEGKLWGLPVTVSPQVIFYNKELFNQAGVEYPEPDWTWDAFLSKVSLLTSEDEKQYGFLDMPLDSQYVVPLSILFPVIVSRTGSLSEFPLSFDDPRMVNAVEWYFSNIRWELEIPPVSEDERKNLIMEGKVAMWIDLARQAGYYRSKLRERYEIGVVPLPGGKTRAAAFLYDGYFISQKSEHPGECWKWIKYLSMHLLPEEYGGWGLPAFQPLAESPQLWEKLGEEVQAYHECLQYEAISSPALFGDYPAFYHRWEAFIKALKRIAQGADIEATLRKAETSIVEPRE